MVRDEDISTIRELDGRELSEDYAKHYGFSLPYDIWTVLSSSQEMAAELLQRREEGRKSCPWRLNIDGVWETGCGHEFIAVIEDEEPMKFCGWCGHRIEETKP